MDTFVITWGAELSIAIRILGVIMVTLFFLPLQFREAQVKNGLILLRYELLIGGILFMFINLPSLYFLFDILDTPQKFTNVLLQILNAVGYLLIAILLVVIYRQQFSEEQKEFHKKVDALEKATA